MNKDPQKDCEHDYDHPVRKGRANLRCPKCGKDITLELVFMQEAIDSSPEHPIDDLADKHRQEAYELGHRHGLEIGLATANKGKAYLSIVQSARESTLQEAIDVIEKEYYGEGRATKNSLSANIVLRKAIATLKGIKSTGV